MTAPPMPAASVSAQAKLRLLATSDLHMHLTGYDYCADRFDASIGLTRTAGLIHAARKEADNSDTLTLLFDNGDALQGTPLGDLAAKTLEQPHPLMRAFNHLGYDAIGLGNHDFNFGLDTLLAVVAQAPCPVISSNLRGIYGQKLPGIEPFAILERTIRVGDQLRPMRIGILSFLPPQTMVWDAYLLLGRVAVDDIVSSAQHWVPHLKQAGCDMIVALAHSGLDCAQQYDGMENAVRPLAAINGIDAIVAGHTHLQLPGKAHAGLDNVCTETGAVYGKPVVMPGTGGSHLGVIDLRVDIPPQKDPATTPWSVAGFDCALRPIASRQPDGTLAPQTGEDPTLSDLLAPLHATTLAQMHQPVGHINRPLHSYFSFIAPSNALAVVAAAQAAALRPMLVGTEAADLPLLSVVAPCKYGCRSGPLHYTDIPAGELLLRHVADLYVFPDQLRAVIITRDQVLDWLEKSASHFNQIIPGSTGTPLINQNTPGHDFDVLHGLTWQIDLSAPARFLHSKQHKDGAPRILNLRLNGKPVAADQKFVVALNSYRAGGGGNFLALKGATPLPIQSISLHATICDYVSGTLPPDPLANALPVWRFKPMQGTSVSFQTGPGATAHLDELSGRGITAHGPGPDGFLHFTLPL